MLAGMTPYAGARRDRVVTSLGGVMAEREALQERPTSSIADAAHAVPARCGLYTDAAPVLHMKGHSGLIDT